MILSIPSVRPLSGAVGGVNGVSLNTWARRGVRFRSACDTRATRRDADHEARRCAAEVVSFTVAPLLSPTNR